tara:strand:- start:8032 stop:8892 length:861 start_codon:yes stop_codon:yes gene_type:complete
MINICVYCNPNYTGNDRLQTIKRDIDLVSQMLILFQSIKKNWTNVDYNFYCFYNKNIIWSDEDIKRVTMFHELNLIGVDKPDHRDLPWQTRIPCFVHPLKKKGTHRLVLDCDMIALKNPIFNLDLDWQCSFDGGVIGENYINYILSYCNFNIDTTLRKNYKKKNLFETFITNPESWKTIYPHFNAGAVLIKENLTETFISHWAPTYDLISNTSLPKHILHMALQYTFSYSLLATSDNWEPFQPGFNYLLKCYEINNFGRDNVSLIHYCGVGGEDIAKIRFPEYFKM